MELNTILYIIAGLLGVLTILATILFLKVFGFDLIKNVNWLEVIQEIESFMGSEDFKKLSFKDQGKIQDKLAKAREKHQQQK